MKTVVVELAREEYTHLIVKVPDNYPLSKLYRWYICRTIFRKLVEQQHMDYDWEKDYDLNSLEVITIDDPQPGEEAEAIDISEELKAIEEQFEKKPVEEVNPKPSPEE